MVHRATLTDHGSQEAAMQRYPDEAAFTYRPHQAAAEVYRRDDPVRAAIRGYSRYDLRI